MSCWLSSEPFLTSSHTNCPLLSRTTPLLYTHTHICLFDWQLSPLEVCLAAFHHYLLSFFSLPLSQGPLSRSDPFVSYPSQVRYFDGMLAFFPFFPPTFPPPPLFSVVLQSTSRRYLFCWIQFHNRLTLYDFVLADRLPGCGSTPSPSVLILRSTPPRLPPATPSYTLFDQELGDKLHYLSIFRPGYITTLAWYYSVCPRAVSGGLLLDS